MNAVYSSAAKTKITLITPCHFCTVQETSLIPETVKGFYYKLAPYNIFFNFNILLGHDMDTTSDKKGRNSIFELLRIFSIFGIVTMHSCSIFLNNAQGHMFLYMNLINTIFNTCVSIFILISGYFSIKFTLKKLFSTWLTILFYSIFSWCIIAISSDTFSLEGLIRSCFPVLSNKYWFATSYIILMIFSPFLNKAATTMKKENLQKLLLSFFILFSAFPSIFIFELPGGGKGTFHLIMMYMIGQYIALYIPQCINYKKTLTITIACITAVFSLNCATTLVYHSIYENATKLAFPMSRDCSFLIIFSAIGIFLIARKWNFKSQIINRIASHVFSIYLMEGAIRNILNHYFNLSYYSKFLIFPLILLIYVSCIMLLGITIDNIRKIISYPIESILWKTLNRFFSFTRNKIIQF